MSGIGRTAFDSSSKRSTLTLSSPLRVVMTVPVDADPVAEVEVARTRRTRRRRRPPSRRTAGSRRCGRACVAKISLPCSRMQHHPAGDGDRGRRSRCRARASPCAARISASVCVRSKRYGYGLAAGAAQVVELGEPLGLLGGQPAAAAAASDRRRSADGSVGRRRAHSGSDGIGSTLACRSADIGRWLVARPLAARHA